MPFVLAVIGDAFQCKLDAIFSNIDFCNGIADDMITGEEQPDGSVHEKCLTEFLQVTRKHNLKLNTNKFQCKLNMPLSLGPLSHLMVTNHKLETIKPLTKLHNQQKSDIQCFLGMVKYLNKYSSRLAEHGDGLRKLTKKNVPFIWGPEHTETFDAIIIEITSTITLKYYDLKQNLSLCKQM